MAKRRGKSRGGGRRFRRHRRAAAKHSAILTLAGVAIVAVPLTYGGGSSVAAQLMGGNWAGALYALASFFVNNGAWFLGAIIPILLVVWLVKKVIGGRLRLSRHWTA